VGDSLSVAGDMGLDGAPLAQAELYAVVLAATGASEAVEP
jgi:hypothetical protein